MFHSKSKQTIVKIDDVDGRSLYSF